MTGNTKSFDTDCKLCGSKCIEGEIVEDGDRHRTYLKINKIIDKQFQFIRKGSHLFVVCGSDAMERPNMKNIDWLKLFGEI